MHTCGVAGRGHQPLRVCNVLVRGLSNRWARPNEATNLRSEGSARNACAGRSLGVLRVQITGGTVHEEDRRVVAVAVVGGLRIAGPAAADGLVKETAVKSLSFQFEDGQICHDIKIVANGEVVVDEVGGQP